MKPAAYNCLSVNVQDLRRRLLGMDGCAYPAYKDLRGSYDFGDFVLELARVQGDPFAAPSRMRALVPAERAGFPEGLYSSRPRSIALRDYITRAFAQLAAEYSSRRGSGNSGTIHMDRPGQQVLERSSVFVDGGDVELRFAVGLPARGRRISGYEAAELVCERLPELLLRSACYESLEPLALAEHVDCVDAESLRAQLEERGLVAFIANGSILPRRSGVDDRPLDREAIEFRSPDSLEVELERPNKGPIRGMGIAAGVTLVTGGGYHGKSTLLRAIETGVYNHVPGDGRDSVVACPSAVKIRAEDGRSVAAVRISAFINNLPRGRSTDSFSTDNASGSTSQAANIIEAIEAGSRLLMVDEDSSATNFMIRDRRMQELIAKRSEPITPFVDRVRQLWEEQGISSLIVIGGSGDYLDVAGTVIGLEGYLVRDLSQRAREVAARIQSERRMETEGAFVGPGHRVLLGQGLDPSRGRRRVSLKVNSRDAILYGEHRIDLSAVEQLVDESQLRAIAEAMAYAASDLADGERGFVELLDLVLDELDRRGLGFLARGCAGNLAVFRRFELAAALNRLRGVVVQQRE
ncbi:MAG: ABC-ATPase domain-containing protein [Candidatus Binatia bacterium]